MIEKIQIAVLQGLLDKYSFTIGGSNNVIQKRGSEHFHAMRKIQIKEKWVPIDWKTNGKSDSPADFYLKDTNGKIFRIVLSQVMKNGYILKISNIENLGMIQTKSFNINLKMLRQEYNGLCLVGSKGCLL